MICIDSSHLKRRYLGTLLLTGEKDSNNQIYPLAMGIEGKKDWGCGLTGPISAH